MKFNKGANEVIEYANRMYIYIYIYIYICVCVYVCVYVCMYVCMCGYVSTCKSVMFVRI